MKKYLLFILLAFAALMSTPQVFAKSSVMPVVVDTDMDFDDWIALLYLLNQPDIKIQAITVAGTGAASCEGGVRNALRLIHFAKKDGIPVACGAEKPLSARPLIVEDDYRHQVDTFYGIKLKSSPEKPSTLSAVDLLEKSLAKSADPVTIIAIAPLTNIASLLKEYPGSTKNIKAIYVMGGTIDHPGNMHLNPGRGKKGKDVAEWNFFADVTAASDVLHSGLPIWLVPLDATSKVPVTDDFFLKLQEQKSFPMVGLAFKILAHVTERNSYDLWDPLAAVLALHPDLGESHTMKLSIVTNLNKNYGQVVRSKKGTSIEVYTQVNTPAFYATLLGGLSAS